jgi:hypothetical protein
MPRQDNRLAEVDAPCAALQASSGAVHTSKCQTVADTAQIDLYDGTLYVCMRDLNSAGRVIKVAQPLCMLAKTRLTY